MVSHNDDKKNNNYEKNKDISSGSSDDLSDLSHDGDEESSGVQIIDDKIVVEGIVDLVIGGGKYKVMIPQLDDMIIDATISGKMRKFNIKILEGDIVTVELSQYDPTQGRITYRHKK